MLGLENQIELMSCDLVVFIAVRPWLHSPAYHHLWTLELSVHLSVLLKGHCGGPRAPRKGRKWRLLIWNMFHDVLVPLTQPYILCAFDHISRIFFHVVWARRSCNISKLKTHCLPSLIDKDIQYGHWQKHGCFGVKPERTWSNKPNHK